jgi:hypothetical protein
LAAIISRTIFGPSLLQRDRRPQPGFLEQRARRPGDQRLGMDSRLLLDRRLHPAPWPEFGRRHQCQNFHTPSGLHRTACRKAQSDARFGRFVHDNQIDAHIFSLERIGAAMRRPAQGAVLTRAAQATKDRFAPESKPEG